MQLCLSCLSGFLQSGPKARRSPPCIAYEGAWRLGVPIRREGSGRQKRLSCVTLSLCHCASKAKLGEEPLAALKRWAAWSIVSGVSKPHGAVKR